MAISVDKIKDLLGTGLQPETVASAVGCDVTYIYKLMSDETFANEVASKRVIALSANTTRDRSIDDIEDRLIEQLKDVVEAGTIYKPNDLLRAFSILNNAKRRGAVGTNSGTVVNNIVQLTIPERMVSKYALSKTNEVVEVEGRTMVTMPAHQLLKQLAEKSNGNPEYKKTLNFLPSNSRRGGGEEDDATANL